MLREKLPILRDVESALEINRNPLCLIYVKRI